ncbi:hypothetical protein FCV25MIE_20552 [Fagus crenata]
MCCGEATRLGGRLYDHDGGFVLPAWRAGGSRFWAGGSRPMGRSRFVAWPWGGSLMGGGGGWPHRFSSHVCVWSFVDLHSRERHMGIQWVRHNWREAELAK